MSKLIRRKIEFTYKIESSFETLATVVDQLLIDKISGNASDPDPQLWKNFQSYDRYQIPYELPRKGFIIKI